MFGKVASCKTTTISYHFYIPQFGKYSCFSLFLLEQVVHMTWKTLVFLNDSSWKQTVVACAKYWSDPGKGQQLWAAPSGRCTWFKPPFDQASALPVLFESQKSESCLLWEKLNCVALLLFHVLCPEFFPMYLLLQQLPDNNYGAYFNFFAQVEKNALL